MHEAHREVGLSHLACKPFNFGSLVAENYRLSDRQSVVQVTESFKLVLIAFDCDEELADTFKCKFVSFHKDLDWFGHKLVCHLKDLLRQSGGDNDALEARRQVSIDVIHLVFEAFC